MFVRAIKSFSGRYGHIRVGQQFNSEAHYAEQLKANGLVVLVDEPGPDKNRSIPQAPNRGAVPPPKKPEPATGKDGATGNTERAPAGGKTRTSRSLRADLALRKKTPTPSVPGETQTPDPATP